MSCSRADAFMQPRGLAAREVVDARKTKLRKREVAALLRGSTRVVAMKGKKVTEFDLKKDPPSEKVLYENLLGPTGCLRAPALRLGKTLVVGFSEETWKTLLR